VTHRATILDPAEISRISRAAITDGPASAEKRACDFGFTYYWARRYPEAIEHCRKAPDLHPAFYRTYAPLARAHASLGLYKDGIEACHTARRLFSGRAFPGHVLATLGYSYGRLGRHTEAHAVLTDMEELGRPYVSEYDVAIVHAGLGSREQALTSLKEAFRQRAFWIMGLPREPLFDDLRAEARFLDLCEAVQKPRSANA
jgi:tetratricopeptide (TPR) repeat protein